MISSVLETPQQIRSRNFRGVAFVSLAIEIAVVFLSVYLGLTQSPLIFISGGVFVVASVMTIVAIRLGRRGDTTNGAWLLIAGFAMGAIAASTILSDIGSMTGMVVLVLILLITIQTMPPEQTRWGFLVGALTSVITSLLVYLQPFPPVSLSETGASTFVLWTGRAAVVGMIAIVLAQYRSMSVNNKILAAFVSMIVVIILMITAVMEITTSNTASAQIGRELSGLAQARASALGDYLNSQVDYMRALALDEMVIREIAAANSAYTGNDALDLANIMRLDEQWQQAVANNDSSAFISSHVASPLAYRLLAFQQLNPSYIQVFVTDEKGALVAATIRTSSYYQGDENWWQVATRNNGQIYFNSPEYGESTGTLSLLLAIPVRDPESDRLIGLLCTNLDLNAIASSVQTPIGETGDTDILFPELRLLLRRTTLKGYIAGFESAIQTASTQGFTVMSYDGVYSIVAAARIETAADQAAVNRLGWVAVVHQSRQEALAPIQGQMNTLSFLGTVLLGIATLLSVATAQPLTRPIVDLTRVASDVARGNLSARAPIRSRDEIGTLAETFNGMTAQLRETLAGLEQRVAERTAAVEASSQQLQNRSSQLQTIAEMSHAIAAIQDINVLLPEVTRLVSERFGYYHVGIFLLDENGEYAVLRAANSEGGQKMLARKHQLRVGQEGVVGFSISQKYPHIALDVGEDAVFFNNPDLPDTHSEISLPLVIGDRVIGALDVQSEQVGAFASEHAEVLTTLANQVAVAIENTRLYSESRETLTELDRTFQRYIRGEWEQFSATATLEGYLANEEGLKPISRSHQTKKASETSAYTVPIKLRGVTIGSLDILANKKPEEYSEDDIAIAQATAERVALALENARLIEESQSRAATERAIGEITSKISGSVNMRNVLRSTVQELGRILPGSEVIIQFQSDRDKKS